MAIALAAMAWTAGARLIAGRLNVSALVGPQGPKPRREEMTGSVTSRRMRPQRIAIFSTLLAGEVDRGKHDARFVLGGGHRVLLARCVR